MRPTARAQAQAKSAAAEPAARPPGAHREGEEDAARQHRLHDQQLADPQRDRLEPVSERRRRRDRPARCGFRARRSTSRTPPPTAPLARRAPVSASASRCCSTDAAAYASAAPSANNTAAMPGWTVVFALVRRSILIVSASMGAGHDGAAKELRRRLEASGHRVEVVDFLDAVAFHIGPVLRWFYQVQLRMAPWSYELSYKMAPVLRGAGGDARHLADPPQAQAGDQGLPARRGACRSTRSRRSCSAGCGARSNCGSR